MSVLASATVAALLIASPSATDVDRLAANGGFLIGNAQRCSIDNDRVVRVGKFIRQLITAASRDEGEEDAATARFSAFFMVSATAGEAGDKLVASCKRVAHEFGELEGHLTDGAVGGSGAAAPRPGDGE